VVTQYTTYDKNTYKLLEFIEKYNDKIVYNIRYVYIDIINTHVIHFFSYGITLHHQFNGNTIIESTLTIPNGIYTLSNDNKHKVFSFDHTLSRYLSAIHLVSPYNISNDFNKSVISVIINKHEFEVSSSEINYFRQLSLYNNIIWAPL
jgi:hypothetical protein